MRSPVRPGATGAFSDNAGHIVAPQLIMMSAIRLLWRNKPVMSTCEKIASPALLDLLLLRIRPLVSGPISCRAIAARQLSVWPARSRVGIQVGFLPET